MSIVGQRLVLNLWALHAPQERTSWDVSWMVDQEHTAMDSNMYWQPKSGLSDETGTSELMKRSVQHAMLNEASTVEHKVSVHGQ